jgi:hypothetical protein
VLAEAADWIKERTMRLNQWIRFKVTLTGILLLATISFSTSSTTAADTPSIAGQWTIHQSIAGNESDQDCTFTVADGKIAGTCKVNDQTPKVTGTVDAKKFTWKYDIEYNGSTLTLTYTGTFDDADKFSGGVEVSSYGVTGDFKGVRAKSAR